MLSGGSSPTGTITFKLKDPNGATVYTNVVTVNGNRTYDNSSGTNPGGYTPTVTGAYTWNATYSGDSNNGSATDNGQNESEVVSKATPRIATTVLNSDNSAIPNGGDAGSATVHDSATVSGGYNPSGTISFTFYSNGTCSGTGTASSTGSAPSANSSPQGPLGAGSYSFTASLAADTNNNAAIGACEPFTVTSITINKQADGGNETFGYTLTGPTNATPNITTTGIPGTGSTGAIAVKGGAYTVSETGIPANWKLTALSCVTGATTVTGSPPTPSMQITAPAGSSTVCTFENSKVGATRTQGFWSTHTSFANYIWNTFVVPAGANTFCGTKTVTTSTTAGANTLMGGYWAAIPKTSTGAARSSLDQARMQMLQQLLGAIENRYGLGTNDNGLIAQGKSAYCGTNVNTIKSLTGQLTTFNSSGDTLPLSMIPPGNATTQTSKTQANLKFWDVLP